jgi:hypothetical protein
LEVEEFVLEDEGDYGVYLIDGQIHESNTSKLSYSWGVDKNIIRTQYVEPAAREIIREIKKRGKVVSQDEAIAIAFAGIKKHKEQYTVFGTEMHKAFQNFDEGKPLNLPTPKHQAFFQGFLYFRKQHEIKPILIEKLLVCPHCGITTQIDNFSEVDGQNTVMDYKTGRTVGFNTPFQLAINKHVLENLGYTVSRTWAVHVQDFLAYPLEMCTPWEDVELRLKNADLKRKTLNPKIYVREFSGQNADAEKKEPDITSDSLAEQTLAHEINSQGHLQIQVKTEPSPNSVYLKPIPIPGRDNIYHGPAGKQLPETVAPQSQFARKRGRPRKAILPKSPSANISLHTADSPLRSRLSKAVIVDDVELDPKHLHPKRLKRRLFQRAA